MFNNTVLRTYAPFRSLAFLPNVVTESLKTNVRVWHLLTYECSRIRLRALICVFSYLALSYVCSHVLLTYVSSHVCVYALFCILL